MSDQIVEQKYMKVNVIGDPEAYIRLKALDIALEPDQTIRLKLYNQFEKTIKELSINE